MQDDLDLAQHLLKKKLVTRQQLVECMRAQALEYQAGKPLAEIFIHRGIVTLEELEKARAELAQAARVRSMTCPRCGATYRVQVKPGKRYRCKKCKAVLHEESARPTPVHQAPKAALSAGDIETAISNALREMETSRPAPEDAGESRAREEESETFEVKELVGSPAPPPAFELSPDAPEEVRQAAEAPENELGRYVLVEPIGRGAMSEVYKAWDKRGDRYVALKFLNAGTQDDIRRLKREAELCSRLEHPNIVRLYDVGEDGQHLYIALEYVEGTTLQSRPGSLRERLELFITVCDAVHYAHTRGILHRDLKPGNILLSREGTVKVTDFGLAQPMTPTIRLARPGAGLFGTPGYMSPEQARGRADEIDARSDVFSLGATLYYLATGREPFDGPDALARLRKVMDDDPVPPRQHDSSLPEPLERIILQALEKGKERRYASPRELAEDVRRFLQGKPVRATRRALPKGLVRRSGSRKWKAAGFLAGLGALAVAGTIVFFVGPYGDSLIANGKENEPGISEAERRARMEVMERYGVARRALVNHEKRQIGSARPFAERKKELEAVRKIASEIRARGSPVGLGYRAALLDGWIQLLEGNYKGAEASCTSAIAAWPESDRSPDRHFPLMIRAEALLRAYAAALRRGFLGEVPDSTVRGKARQDLHQLISRGCGSAGQQAYYRAAKSMLDGNLREALKEIDKGLSGSPEPGIRSKFLALRGDTLFLEGNSQWDKAREAYRAAGRLLPEDHTCLGAWAWLNLQTAGTGPAALARLDEGIEAAGTAARTAPDPDPYTYLEAALLARKVVLLAALGEDVETPMRRSREIFDRVLSSPIQDRVRARVHEHIALMWHARARAARSRGLDAGEAVTRGLEHVKKAFAANERPGASLYALRARLLWLQAEAMQQTDPAAAINAYTKALEDLNEAVAREEKAEYFEARGRLHIILSRFSSGNEGRARKRQQLVRAIANLEKCAALRTSNAESFTELARARLMLADLQQPPIYELDRAITAFNDAIQANPEYAPAVAGRGTAYWKRGRYLIERAGEKQKGRRDLEQALRDWERAIRNDEKLKPLLESRVAEARKLLETLD